MRHHFINGEAVSEYNDFEKGRRFKISSNFEA